MTAPFDSLPELGKQLREARLKSGMTLQELGDKTGYNASHLSTTERGVRGTTLKCLMDVGSALGLRLEFRDLRSVDDGK